jgi:hypothetical protein
MAGLESSRAQEYVTDLSRFKSHEHLRTPDGQPLLSRRHNYITIWGVWQGRIGAPGGDALPLCTGIDLVHAQRSGLITEEERAALWARQNDQLEAAGFEAHLKPSHLLLSREEDGTLRRDEHGDLLVTVCNFELLRRRPAEHPRT